MGPLQVIEGVPSSDREMEQVRVMVDSPAIPRGCLEVMETEVITTKKKYIAVKKIYWYNLVESDFILHIFHNSCVA